MTVNDELIIKGFVKAILEGKLTIEQVPDTYKDKVQEALEK